MPNVLDATGLTVKSQSEIVDDLTAGYIAIYGADINVDSNTPDGQQINIYATALEDNLELLTSVYNQFSLANAFGVQVDNLVALNGIQRQAGTQTLAYITVTVTQALTLPGLDVLVATPGATVFTVSDAAGNQYQLQTSHVFSGAGSASLAFLAVNIGQTLTSPNTLTVIVTPLAGVSTANNPTVAGDVIGQDEETDVALKIRQAQSLQLAATGPADTLRAQLLNIPGVVDAFVPENDTNGVVNGVPAYGIWVIVRKTTATDAEIGQAIYAKKTLGCAQKTSAAHSYVITRPAGNTFTAYWDLAVAEDLYVDFTIKPINGVDTFNTTAIAAALAAALSFKLNQSVFVGDIIRAMQVIAPNAYLTDTLVGKTASPALQVVTPTTYQKYFTLDAANITITT